MSKFDVGDRVRVITPAWNSGYRVYHVDPGDIGEITEGPDGPGDYHVKFNEHKYSWIGGSNLERVSPSVGTATLDIQVRFFLGDKDVTDMLKGLVEAAK